MCVSVGTKILREAVSSAVNTLLNAGNRFGNKKVLRSALDMIKTKCASFLQGTHLQDLWLVLAGIQCKEVGRVMPPVVYTTQSREKSSDVDRGTKSPYPKSRKLVRGTTWLTQEVLRAKRRKINSECWDSFEMGSPNDDFHSSYAVEQSNAAPRGPTKHVRSPHRMDRSMLSLLQQIQLQDGLAESFETCSDHTWDSCGKADCQVQRVPFYAAADRNDSIFGSVSQ
jgi:hypothetical protein